jgi:hypothetical protein
MVSLRTVLLIACCVRNHLSHPFAMAGFTVGSPNDPSVAGGQGRPTAQTKHTKVAFLVFVPSLRRGLRVLRIAGRVRARCWVVENCTIDIAPEQLCSTEVHRAYPSVLPRRATVWLNLKLLTRGWSSNRRWACIRDGKGLLRIERRISAGPRSHCQRCAAPCVARLAAERARLVWTLNAPTTLPQDRSGVGVSLRCAHPTAPSPVESMRQPPRGSSCLCLPQCAYGLAVGDAAGLASPAAV